MEHEYTEAARKILRIVLGDYFYRVKLLRSRGSADSPVPGSSRTSSINESRSLRDTVFGAVAFRERMASLLYRCVVFYCLRDMWCLCSH